MSDNDQGYWATRAEAELARARTAATPAASNAHRELAALYLDRAHGGGAQQRPRLRVVAG